MSKVKDFQRITDIYQPAIQLTKGIVLILDQDGMIVSFNEFLESTTGYSYTELIQKNWFDLFLLEDEIDSAKRYFRRFLLGGKKSGKIITKIITSSRKECFRGGYRFEESPYRDTNIVGNLTGFSLGLGINFGGTKLDLSYDHSERKADYQFFNVGFTDAATIDKNNDTLTLTLGFSL